jgi:hypothetical protein
MIHEPRDAAEKHYDKAIATQELKDKWLEGKGISCGHDFWEQAKKAEFGDILLCTCCHQYFAKIKNLPWIIRRRKSFACSRSKFTYPPHSNHLDGAWFTPIDVRLTD